MEDAEFEKRVEKVLGPGRPHITVKVPVEVREFEFSAPVDPQNGAQAWLFAHHTQSPILTIREMRFLEDDRFIWKSNGYPFTEKLLVVIALRTNRGPIELVSQSPSEPRVEYTVH